MRITSYDPRVSAAVYSQRRAAEEGFESGIATGLARLGRAVSAREERSRRAGAGAMAVREALGFWDDEVRRLDDLGATTPPGGPGFHDLAMKEHLARRTEAIARLNEADPAQAEIFDLRTRPLVEALERRASAMEAEAAGRTLSAGIGGAMASAVRAVRVDPLQHDAIRGGLIDDGRFEDARELLAEGRMPALTPEDRREQERLVGRAERRAEATGLAELAAARDAYWAGFRDLAAGLREGREAPDVRYTDEMIRAALPAAQAEEMIALREAAEDAGDAHGRIALASREAVDALIRDAGPEEARHLRAAARARDRRLAEDPAAYVLGNARVRAAEDAWRAALEGDDPDAIASTALAYARASLDEQRRLGVVEADRRVLPAGSAASMVTAFTAAERPDPAGLGAELRERFEEHWRPVLEELKAAGLPEGMAAIAAMDRPEQRAAAQRLSVLVGTPTAELRGRIDGSEAEAVDKALKAVAPELRASSAASPEAGRATALTLRRAYDLVAAGEEPTTAATKAAAETIARSPGEAAALKQSAPLRLATAQMLPGDRRPQNIRELALRASESQGVGIEEGDPTSALVTPDFWDGRILVFNPDAPPTADGELAGENDPDVMAAFQSFEESSGFWLRPLPDGRLGIGRPGRPETYIPVSPDFAIFLAGHPDLAGSARPGSADADFLPAWLGAASGSYRSIDGSAPERAEEVVTDRSRMAEIVGRDLSRLLTVHEVRQPQIDAINGLLEDEGPLGATVALSIVGYLRDRENARTNGHTRGMSASEIALRGNLDFGRLADHLEDEYRSTDSAIEAGPPTLSDQYRSHLTVPQYANASSDLAYWGSLPRDNFDAVIRRFPRLISVVPKGEVERRSAREADALGGLVETLIAPFDPVLADYLQGARRAFADDFEGPRSIPPHYFALLDNDSLFAMGSAWGFQFPKNPAPPDVPDYLKEDGRDLAGPAGDALSIIGVIIDPSAIGIGQAVLGKRLGDIAAEKGDQALETELARYYWELEVDRREEFAGDGVLKRLHTEWTANWPESEDQHQDDDAVRGPADFLGTIRDGL